MAGQPYVSRLPKSLNLQISLKLPSGHEVQFADDAAPEYSYVLRSATPRISLRCLGEEASSQRGNMGSQLLRADSFALELVAG